ncbi:hypothetical protein [Candidatus Marithrix sp. Canyon 246]|uniref:hypothetical protein n=1 Tax=Candidatus Marithrix sp. Canyon 246 TaxID=1827136 RepID=UPI00084A2C23|nr:hypothetical protein [Candidatus Marithrix sp. Canyon 246]
MRVILKAEMFACQHINQLDLISLIKLGFDCRHLIQVEPLDANEVSNWLDKQSDDIRDECEWVFESGYSLDRDEYGQFSPLTIQVADVDKPQWLLKVPVLPLKIALKFLAQDFIIFVENRRNDSAFLRATATGWRKDKLEELLKNGGIKFEGGGGIGEILKWIEEIANFPEKCQRSFALFDSDALKPNKPSKQSTKIVTACKEIIPYHQLKRRAIENYLPYGVLSAWMGMNVHQKIQDVSKKNIVNAFKQLSYEQRHHFNMKKGFKADENKDVGDFYDNISNEVKKTLEHGFGDDIAELFKEQQFKIQEDWLLKDNLTEELNPMLEKLLSLV